MSIKLGENETFFLKDEQPRLSSLDLVAYACLKEIQVNLQDSPIENLLTKEYKNLVAFVKRFDELIGEDCHKLKTQLAEGIRWNIDKSNVQPIV